MCSMSSLLAYVMQSIHTLWSNIIVLVMGTTRRRARAPGGMDCSLLHSKLPSRRSPHLHVVFGIVVRAV